MGRMVDNGYVLWIVMSSLRGSSNVVNADLVRMGCVWEDGLGMQGAERVVAGRLRLVKRLLPPEERQNFV